MFRLNMIQFEDIQFLYWNHTLLFSYVSRQIESVLDRKKLFFRLSNVWVKTMFLEFRFILDLFRVQERAREKPTVFVRNIHVVTVQHIIPSFEKSNFRVWRLLEFKCRLVGAVGLMQRWVRTIVYSVQFGEIPFLMIWAQTASVEVAQCWGRAAPRGDRLPCSWNTYSFETKRSEKLTK